jgi:hypothetical protein
MAKKIILTALVGVLLSVFAGNASAFGGRHNGGGGFYRQDYHRQDCHRQDYHRQDYHNRRAIIAPPQRRPAVVCPSRRFISNSIIVIRF